MTTIETLLKLQDYDNKSYEIERELNKILDIKTIQDDKVKLEDFKDDIEIISKSIKEEKSKSIEVYDKLNNLYKNHENLNTNLYSGKIKDFQKLEDLNKEIEVLQKDINVIEEEYFNIVNHIDILEKENLKNNECLLKIKNKINIEQSKVEGNIDRYKRELADLISKKETILDSMDLELVSEYNFIKRKKNKFICEVKEGICTGCNIKLPTFILSDLDNDELIYCDNCNRIIYKKDS